MSDSSESDKPETDKTQLIISKLVRLSSTTTDKYPSGTDYRYFSSYPSFNEQSNNLSNNVLTLLNKLCNFVTPNSNTTPINLLTETNEYLRWQTISDSADHCIEQVDMCLDTIKDESNHNVNNNPNHNYNNSNSHSSNHKKNKLFPNDNISNHNSLDLLYPQSKFLNTIDNTRNTPFKPNLIDTTKTLELITDSNSNIGYYSNPYLNDINNIKYNPQQLTYFRCDELLLPNKIDYSLLYWINSEHTLLEMCNYISTHCTEIGLDLEHNNKYTFYGMTCLIQISIKNNNNDIIDYIIDVITLRNKIHKYLNPILCNDKIIKIFHGCYNDILWLQRDFSCYCINVFDTYEACKLLNLPQKSLKYLLKTYCNINTNKYLRLSDWRIRPLTQELISYARNDTHYLLYLYKYLTNKLIDKSTININLLNQCYHNSAQICGNSYKKPYFNLDGWKDLCQYNGWYFINNKSLNVLSKLYEWRDRIGRELDQSIGVVLSNKILKQICNDLPENINKLGKYNLSVIGRKYVNDILNIISECVKEKCDMNVMFECDENKNNNGNDLEDLNAICMSNNGCFDIVSNDMKIMNVNMMNQYEKSTFFPMDNGKEIDGKLIVDSIFNEMETMPVFMDTFDGNINIKRKKKKNKRKKKRGGSKCDKLVNNLNSNKQKLKNNNWDSVATADDRNKIFGSRYVDRNSKKDVFKLPRIDNDKKKRKGNKVNEFGPVLENMQPKKKRRLSKVKRKEKRLERMQQNERMEQINLVDNEWPMDENDGGKDRMDNGVDNGVDNIGNDMENSNDKREADIDDDIEVTESDMLDAAPVPVIDTKFNDVYDPFK